MVRSLRRHKLSDRYITDRFLPDKAVDLIDEAAARLKIELDSMPTEIDRIERQVMQLEMERQALEKENDDASAARLAKVTEEMANLKEESATLMARWRNEKDVIDVVREAQETYRRASARSGASPTNGQSKPCIRNNLWQPARCRKKISLMRSKKLSQLQADSRILKEEVTEEDIARVISSWTGIPVSRLQEGERQKACEDGGGALGIG